MKKNVALLRLARLNLLAALVLTGCMHEAVTPVTGPAVEGVSVTKTGVIFPQSVRDRWLEEGVPASYFTALPHDRFYISNVEWHAGNQIRLDRANGVKL